MKKYFENPVLRIVEVKNDIIATSDSANNGQGYNAPGYEGGYAPGRGIWDDVEDEF